MIPLALLTEIGVPLAKALIARLASGEDEGNIGVMELLAEDADAKSALRRAVARAKAEARVRAAQTKP